MTPSIPTPVRPIDEEPGGGLTPLGRAATLILVLALIAMIALIVRPELLPRLVPDWRGDPDAVKLGAFAALLGVLFVSAISGQARVSRARRASFAAFATASGGIYSERPFRSTPAGWEGGPRVDYRIGGVEAALTSVSASRSARMTRLCVALPGARDAQLQILPGGRTVRFLMSRTVLALDRMRYLASDPVSTGDERLDREMIVKASDAHVGSAVAADAGVREGLRALHALDRGFRLALERPSEDGPSRLFVEATAQHVDIDRLVAMDRLLRAALDSLGRAGLFEREARRA